eukprot:NODE_115_length_1895_cov_386.173348_g80_i0.p1 GENE.NODE_115_length_1895_cov_386.173348_g80_i0~~NODE_115_length_1895_cov_386.173348_g80_i0.p1  ORF type:complete len:304 (+),score=106.41 NODE_115_length_1895_cov_386.173348_g80_i0:116-1027(+)
MGTALTKYVFLPPPSTYDHRLTNLIFIEDRLPALFYEFTSVYGSDTPYTILFCHGNAEDLGCVSAWLKVIRDYCHVNVLAYEYRGYGVNHGKPSEDQVYEDAQKAYRFLTDQKKMPPYKIILFGRSLGSGPATHLASQLFAPFQRSSLGSFGCGCRSTSLMDYDFLSCPGGVILQSPLSSVIGVVSPAAAHVAPGDMFTNYSKIDKIQCPVLIIHGSKDTVVPCAHGRALSQKVPNLYQFLELQGAGHNDLEENYTNEFLTTLQHYIQALDGMRAQVMDRQKAAAAPRDPTSPLLTRKLVLGT